MIKVVYNHLIIIYAKRNKRNLVMNFLFFYDYAKRRTLYSQSMDSVSKDNFQRLYNLILKAETKHIF